MSSLLIDDFFNIFLLLTTNVIFLNPIFLISSILCSRMVLSSNFDRSLLFFDLNLVLLPAASNIN